MTIAAAAWLPVHLAGARHLVHVRADAVSRDETLARVAGSTRVLVAKYGRYGRTYAWTRRTREDAWVAVDVDALPPLPPPLRTGRPRLDVLARVAQQSADDVWAVQRAAAVDTRRGVRRAVLATAAHAAVLEAVPAAAHDAAWLVDRHLELLATELLEA